jgi:hypothetical protein
MMGRYTPIWPAKLILLATAAFAPAQHKPNDLAKPVPEGRFLRPASSHPAEPVWGIKDGIEIGLWPMGGPRGLIRVYAPYLGQKRPRMVNFISIEPVIGGKRGQSELEVGLRSKRAGLSFWTADTRHAVAEPREPTAPARGRFERVDGVEVLTFYLATEPFRNGARPVLQVMLRADRLYEVGFRVMADKRGTPLDSCVLSATMGNYGRLRRLWLADEVVDSRKLWPKFTPDRLNFAPWKAWPGERLLKVGAERIVAATSDEADPARAEYDPKVPPHWRYQGKAATHYWRTKDAEGLVTRVNGRTTYWGESGRIPGGISYENFEMEAPLAPGQEFWFGVTPDEPEKLGFNADSH